MVSLPALETVPNQAAPRRRRGRWSALTRAQKWGLIGLWIVAIIVGGFVETRGALLHDRHTDVGVYFRAAWAVRVGENPYRITDDNHWHYVYPPLLAILMMPLADAPHGAGRAGLLPYAVSVGIWYVLSVICLAVAVNALARAIGAILDRQSGTASDSAVSAQRWWMLCFWPLALCIPVIIRSVIRGQVGPLWLWLTAGMIVAVINRHSFRAGVWLAASVCIKVIPLYLLLYPLWRRDLRMLAGCAAGLFLGLVAIPWATMGTHRFVQTNRHYLTAFLIPSVTGKPIDKVLQKELENPKTSDNNSFVAVFRNMGHIFAGTPFSYTPPRFARIGHWLFAGMMTLLTLAAAGWKRRNDPLNEALFLGLLVVVMLPSAPVCHPHYFMLMLPLLTAMFAMFLARPPKVKVGWWLLLAFIPLSHIITGMGDDLFRYTGLVLWAAVATWIAGAWMLWRHSSATSVTFALSHPPVAKPG